MDAAVTSTPVRTSRLQLGQETAAQVLVGRGAFIMPKSLMNEPVAELDDYSASKGSWHIMNTGKDDHEQVHEGGGDYHS